MNEKSSLKDQKKGKRVETHFLAPAQTSRQPYTKIDSKKNPIFAN